MEVGESVVEILRVCPRDRAVGVVLGSGVIVFVDWIGGADRGICGSAGEAGGVAGELSFFLNIFPKRFRFEEEGAGTDTPIVGVEGLGVGVAVGVVV